KGTKNDSLDHIFASTDPNVLADKTKFVSDGLETVLTTPETVTSNVAKPSEEITFGEIKHEDLEKLVLNVKAEFKDIDSIEDNPIIVVDDSKDVTPSFCLAKDSNTSQPSVSTPVDTKMHKEDLQAAGGPTYLDVTSEEGAHPQFSSDFTAEVDLGTFAPNDSLPP
nr:hypothetical protein [Tanacetum cinerariifolium]